MGDIKLKISSDGTEYLELNERQTKTRTGENLSDVRRVTPKMFATNENDPRNPVALYKIYAQKRPANFCDVNDPFYLAPNTIMKQESESDHKESVQWFIRQKIGMNKLSKMLRMMATEAGLPVEKRLTNHSTRKHLVQKLREHNIPATEIMSVTGHKNVQSILNYSNVSHEQQKKCSNILASHGQNADPIQGRKHSVTSTATFSSTQPPSQPEQHQTEAEILPETQVQVPHPQPQYSFQQSLSSSFKSQFFGATFNIQNFHVHNN